LGIDGYKGSHLGFFQALLRIVGVYQKLVLWRILFLEPMMVVNLKDWLDNRWAEGYVMFLLLITAQHGSNLKQSKM
jgi:hypothetical protein